MRFAGVVLGALLLVAPLVHAEPYEFYACNFHEGKDMADLDKVLVGWKAAVDKLQTKGYTAVVLTPQFTGEADIPDFYWMGSWPDAAALGSGMKEWIEDGAGSSSEAAFNAVADCTQASLWWGRTVYGGK